MPTHIQLIFTHHTRSKLSLSSPLATFSKLQHQLYRFQLQLSYPNEMHHTCLPITPPKRYQMSRTTNMSTTQQLNGIPFQMTSRRTQHEPTLTLQLTCSLQSKCLQDGPTNLSRAYQIPLKFFEVKNLKRELYMQSSRLKVQVQSFITLAFKGF